MDALTQHFYIPAICLLRCLLSCLICPTNTPWAWSVCPEGISTAESWHLRWTWGVQRTGEAPCRQLVVPHLIRFKSVPLMHTLDYECVLWKSPAFPQLPRFCSLLLLPGKYFFSRLSAVGWSLLNCRPGLVSWWGEAGTQARYYSCRECLLEPGLRLVPGTHRWHMHLSCPQGAYSHRNNTAWQPG